MAKCSAVTGQHKPGSLAQRRCEVHGEKNATARPVAVSAPPPSGLASVPAVEPVRPEVTGDQRKVMRDQIGFGNVLAISGGRITPISSGIELPVAHGYRVRVHLDPDDTYTVERIHRRGLNETVKGSREGVYAWELGETAYRAGMYASFTEHEWVR